MKKSEKNPKGLNIRNKLILVTGSLLLIPVLTLGLTGTYTNDFNVGSNKILKTMFIVLY